MSKQDLPSRKPLHLGSLSLQFPSVWRNLKVARIWLERHQEEDCISRGIESFVAVEWPLDGELMGVVTRLMDSKVVRAEVGLFPQEKSKSFGPTEKEQIMRMPVPNTANS